MSARRAGRGCAALAVSSALLAGCSATPEGVEASGGWRVEVLRDDLQGPTQITLGPDGHLYVAELAGGEREGEGRVLDLGAVSALTPLADGQPAPPRVVLDGLLTPTGLAVTDDAVWVQERTELVRFDGTPDALGPRSVIHTVTVFNGRSQGTLTQLPDARIVHTATGAGSGPDATGTGLLLASDPDAGPGDEPEILATGFKNAYAHAVDPLFPESGLYVTEVGDGRYDGESPKDELNRLSYGLDVVEDAGWPSCTSMRNPTKEHGVTDEDCEPSDAGQPLRPWTTFRPQATPTSVAPLESGLVLVALWLTGEVVAATADDSYEVVLSGVANPQHLLALDDGSVLLTVHGSGELWRLTRG